MLLVSLPPTLTHRPTGAHRVPGQAIWTTVCHVSDLWSILTPLTGTLPGWPAAPQPSLVTFLGLIVAIPVGISLLVFLLTMAKSLARAGKGGAVHMQQPLWLGETSSRKALTSDSAPSETGGASARW